VLPIGNEIIGDEWSSTAGNVTSGRRGVSILLEHDGAADCRLPALDPQCEEAAGQVALVISDVVDLPLPKPTV